MLNLEKWQWDDVVCPKPEGFDSWWPEDKVEAIEAKRNEIQFIVGPAYEDYCRHMIDAHGDEEQWIAYRKWMYEMEKEGRANRRSFVEEEIQCGIERGLREIGVLSSCCGSLLLNLLCILLGFAIGFYLV